MLHQMRRHNYIEELVIKSEKFKPKQSVRLTTNNMSDRTQKNTR